MTATTVNFSVTGASARDYPLEDVAMSAWTRHADTPRSVLLQMSRDKLQRLVELPEGWDSHRGRPVTILAASVLAGVLDSLVMDDVATPQIAPLPDGGVQVEWLVSGDSVEIDVSPEGAIVILATYSDGQSEVEAEFYHYAPDVDAIERSRMFLGKISQNVSHRLAAR
jgi:hypothetical protein